MDVGAWRWMDLEMLFWRATDWFRDCSVMLFQIVSAVGKQQSRERPRWKDVERRLNGIHPV